MIRAWPYVVLIDTTYKTNKQMIERYSWVLQGLRDILGTDQTPSIIVTDREEGLSAVIRDVFSSKKVLLINYCCSLY